MEAVRGVIDANGSAGRGGAFGCRAPHLAQKTSAASTWEADYAVGAKAFRRQHDDRTDPAESGNVAEDGGRTRRDRRERVGGTRWSIRLPGAALGAEDIRRVHLVPALAAKRHP